MIQWFEEDPSGLFEPKYTKLRWKIKKHLFSGRSSYQKIDFYESFDHGILLVLDDLIMCSTRDEFTYHEMLVHVPLFTHPSPKQLLIIGGGDGGALYQAICHPQLQVIQQCEIDEMVIEKSKEFMPYLDTALQDPRTGICIQDAFDFLEKSSNCYDLILMDSTDPIGPAERLFGKEFFQSCFRALKEDGLMSMQCGSPFYHVDWIAELNSMLNQNFPITKLYSTVCPSYPGGNWSFLLASKQYHPLTDFDETRVQNLGFRYYNPEIHRSAFALPQYLKEALQ